MFRPSNMLRKSVAVLILLALCLGFSAHLFPQRVAAVPFSRIHYTDLAVGTEISKGIRVHLYGRGLNYLSVVYLNGCKEDFPTIVSASEAYLEIENCHDHLRIGSNAISSRPDKDEVLITLRECLHSDECQFPDSDLVVSGN